MEELSPKELLLKTEGEAMLRAVAAQKPQSAIVGPDGQALPASTAGATVPAPNPAEQVEKIRRQQRDKAEDASQRLSEIVAHDESALRACEIMLIAHKLVCWAKMELGQADGVSDEIIEYAERFMRAKAYAGKGFHIQSLHAQTRDFAVKYLKERMMYYAQEAKARQARLHEIKRRLGGSGITLPTPIKAKFENSFMPGQLLILHGSAAAVREAAQICSRLHKNKDKAQVYYLSNQTGETEGEWATTVMPPSWWRGSGTALVKLYEVLDPVVKSACMLVVVEEIESFMLISEAGQAPQERRSLILKRLYQWAVETQTAVIVGDVTDQDIPRDNRYGHLPNVEVVVGADGTGVPCLYFDKQVYDKEEA